jgi:hypothetical protein
MSYRFVDSFRTGSRWNILVLLEICLQTCMTYTIASILILLESCLQTCMTYTIAGCTVKNAWWWTEQLSEICRVSFQKKFEKSMCIFGFVTKKFITMHGHMNVKKIEIIRVCLWLQWFLPMSHFIYLFVTLHSSRQYRYAFICGLYSSFETDGLYVPYMNVIVHEFSLDINLNIFKNNSASQRLSKILHHWKSRPS